MAEPWPLSMRLETAARCLDCSPSQLRKLIADGALRVVQYVERGDRYVTRESVESFLATRAALPVTSPRAK